MARDLSFIGRPHEYDARRVFSLTGAERTYRLIVETMNEAALTVGLDKTILFCNQRFCDLVKSPMADTIGRNLDTFVAPAQQPPLRTLLANAQSGPVQRRLTLRAADGSTVSVQIAASLLAADGDTSICLVASDLTELEAKASSIRVLREQQQALEESRAELQAANAALSDSRRAALNVAEDAIAARSQAEETSAELRREAAERRRAEESLKKLNAELEYRVAERTAELREKDQILVLQSRLAAMGEMIGNIAHQWRQPLNALGLTIQQLSLVHDLGELNKEFLDHNVKSSMELIKHMSKTIDDFRNYFRPDKEKAEFKVSEAIANTVSLIEDNFKNQHINIEVVAKDDPSVFGYRNEFAQALLNILNNAGDALKEREINDPRVTIDICSKGGNAVIVITDNAGGIPEEIMGKIFDPYFTTKGPQAGTGIGLFMSKSIIEKNMGGSLVARNVADGAEFKIEV